MQLDNLGIEPSLLIAIYKQMATIRAVDRAVQAGLSSGRFTFSYWPMTGQEAIPATLAQLTSRRDYMVTTYRGVHDQIAKGVSLKHLFCEMLGRRQGVNKGKGGSPHISDPGSGSMLTTGIVGAGTPIANGLALAAHMRGEDRVTFVNFGDGATSIGAVHEAMNLAGVWKLPIIFLCQNNQIGEYTRIAGYTVGKAFAERAEALGFKGVQLDGNDTIAFYRGMKPIVQGVRAGNGPVFVEALTLRLGPHTGVGFSKDLSKDELEAGKTSWPVPRTRALLLEIGVCSEAQLAEIDAVIQGEVDEALDFATADEPTGVEETLIDVFANPEDVPQRGHFPVRSAEGVVSGETQPMLMLEAVRSAQETALRIDENVVLIGEDIGDPPGGVFGTSRGLQTEFGERVRPTPIAEQAIIGAGIGAALVGMRPVTEIMFCDFTAVCLDQIANHAAKQRFMSGGATHVPMTIRMLVGGGTGGFGAQHSQSLEAWLLHTPGLKVIYPSTPYDAKGLLLSCIFDDDPCVHLESVNILRGTKNDVPLGDYRIPLGVAKVRREGTDISVISYGWQVNHCLAAAETLQAEGISAEVIDLRSLVPLDYHRVLDSVKKTRRAIVIHAATEFCGFGAELASTINEELFSKLKGPAVRFGAHYAPIAYSRPIEMGQIPSAASITERVRSIVKSSS